MQTERIIERTTQENTGAKAISAQQYLHTPLAAVIVPLAVAFVTGIMVGLLIFIPLVAARIQNAWVWGVMAWLVVQLFTWAVMLWRWFGLTSLEAMTGIDINGDGQIGKPKKSQSRQARVVQVNLRTVQPNGHVSAVDRLFFPGEPEAMVMLATALLGGASTAERQWSGEGKLFSQQEYREIRKIMNDYKLIELKNEKDVRQGYCLTDKGVQTMEQIRDTYSDQSPHPLGEDD